MEAKLKAAEAAAKAAAGKVAGVGSSSSSSSSSSYKAFSSRDGYSSSSREDYSATSIPLSRGAAVETAYGIPLKPSVNPNTNVSELGANVDINPSANVSELGAKVDVNIGDFVMDELLDTNLVNK